VEPLDGVPVIAIGSALRLYRATRVRLDAIVLGWALWSSPSILTVKSSATRPRHGDDETSSPRRAKPSKTAIILGCSSWPVPCERDRHAHQEHDENDDGRCVRDDLSGGRLQRRKRRRDAGWHVVWHVVGHDELQQLELVEHLGFLGSELRSQEGELVLGVLEGLRRRHGVSELLLGLLQEVHGPVRDELRLRSGWRGLVRDQREGQQPLQRRPDEMQLMVEVGRKK